MKKQLLYAGTIEAAQTSSGVTRRGALRIVEQTEALEEEGGGGFPEFSPHRDASMTYEKRDRLGVLFLAPLTFARRGRSESREDSINVGFDVWWLPGDRSASVDGELEFLYVVTSCYRL